MITIQQLQDIIVSLNHPVAIIVSFEDYNEILQILKVTSRAGKLRLYQTEIKYKLSDVRTAVVDLSDRKIEEIDVKRDISAETPVSGTPSNS